MAKFSKILSKTDTKKRLSVPTKFLKSLPPFKLGILGSHAIKFEAKDRRGEAWVFHCSIRKRGHPKPVLTKGSNVVYVSALMHMKGVWLCKLGILASPFKNCLYSMYAHAERKH